MTAKARKPDNVSDFSQPHKTLEERLEEFYGLPFDEIPNVETEEVDWGKTEGTEYC